MSIDPLISQIADQGVFGVFLVLLGWAYWKKDQRVRELNEKIKEIQDKRLADALSFKDEALRITNRLNDLVDKWAEITEKHK